MIVELADRGEPIDMLLFDDPGSCDVCGCDRSRPKPVVAFPSVHVRIRQKPPIKVIEADDRQCALFAALNGTSAT